jgi:hypothetical protein
MSLLSTLIVEVKATGELKVKLNGRRLVFAFQSVGDREVNLRPVKRPVYNKPNSDPKLKETSFALIWTHRQDSRPKGGQFRQAHDGGWPQLRSMSPTRP